MIIDSFIFFNELDLLELRLKELWDVVDRFVLDESTRLHSRMKFFLRTSLRTTHGQGTKVKLQVIYPF